MTVLSVLLGVGLNLQPALRREVGSAPHRARCVRMGLFDGLAAAFENDDSLGERQDAGLKSKLKTSTVTWMGPKPEGPMAAFTKQTVIEQTVRPGQTLKELSEEAGVPVVERYYFEGERPSLAMHFGCVERFALRAAE